MLLGKCKIGAAIYWNLQICTEREYIEQKNSVCNANGFESQYSVFFIPAWTLLGKLPSLLTSFWYADNDLNQTFLLITPKVLFLLIFSPILE